MAGVGIGKGKILPTYEYCVVCGTTHEVDSMSYTKRKTYVFWSQVCLEKELKNNENKE